MTALIEVISAGPGLSIQDRGRPGGMGIGLSAGGAADREALLQGHALLGNPLDAAALEMAGLGGRFRLRADALLALTGAAMRARLDEAEIPPLTTFAAPAGSILDIGPARSGVYGYLHVAGGFDAPLILGGRGYHRIAGLGRPVQSGDTLAAVAPSPRDTAPLALDLPPPSTEPLHVMEGPQTGLFPPQARERFEETEFKRSPKGNRQGVRLDHAGPPFATDGQRTLVSDFVIPGDIQMTGDGTPYVLLVDCQTMGGYPRIGTVLPADLSRIAQAEPGTPVRFRFVSLEEAEQSWESDETRLDQLRKCVSPRIRDPHEMRDLLSYELISRPILDP